MVVTFNVTTLFLPNVIEFFPVSLDESLMPQYTKEYVDINDDHSSMDLFRTPLMDRYLTYVNIDCVTI